MKSQRMTSAGTNSLPVVSSPAAISEPVPRAGFVQRFQERNRRIRDWVRERGGDRSVVFGYMCVFYFVVLFADAGTARDEAWKDANMYEIPGILAVSALLVALAIAPVTLPLRGIWRLHQGLAWVLGRILFGRE